MIEVKAAKTLLETIGKHYTKKLSALLPGENSEFKVVLSIEAKTEVVNKDDKGNLIPETVKRRYFTFVLQVQGRTPEVEKLVVISRQSIDVIGIPVQVRQQDFIAYTAQKMFDIFRDSMMKFGIQHSVYVKSVQDSLPIKTQVDDNTT